MLYAKFLGPSFYFVMARTIDFKFVMQLGCATLRHNSALVGKSGHDFHFVISVTTEADKIQFNVQFQFVTELFCN